MVVLTQMGVDSPITVSERPPFVNRKKLVFPNVASITAQKSEETLRDYAATDMEDQKKISNILPVKPAMGVPCNTVQSVPQPSMRQPLLPLSQNILPCIFNNCTIYFSASNTSSSLMQMQGSSSQQSCCHSDPPLRNGQGF